jgi:hypothetical protein
VITRWSNGWLLGAALLAEAPSAPEGAGVAAVAAERGAELGAPGAACEAFGVVGLVAAVALAATVAARRPVPPRRDDPPSAPVAQSARAAAASARAAATRRVRGLPGTGRQA